MEIPQKIMNAFYNEINCTNYGKVTLAVIKRGKHRHYEIVKNFTLTDEEEAIDSNQAGKHGFSDLTVKNG
jgi:hypothetical protein